MVVVHILTGIVAFHSLGRVGRRTSGARCVISASAKTRFFCTIAFASNGYRIKTCFRAQTCICPWASLIYNIQPICPLKFLIYYTPPICNVPSANQTDAPVAVTPSHVDPAGQAAHSLLVSKYWPTSVRVWQAGRQADTTKIKTQTKETKPKAKKKQTNKQTLFHCRHFRHLTTFAACPTSHTSPTYSTSVAVTTTH